MGEFDFALLVGIDLIESMLIRFWIRQALWYSGVSAPTKKQQKNETRVAYIPFHMVNLASTF